ncbi:hypothetical protein K2P56_00795 [Patescibacteria group bacterium]|nr:hypothetical protein [Patescibacteria group bacterium]
MGEIKKEKTDRVMGRGDFDDDIEAAEMAARIEAMTEEEAKQWLLTEGGYTETQLNDALARTDGFIFDLIYKDDPNKGNA